MAVKATEIKEKMGSKVESRAMKVLCDGFGNRMAVDGWNMAEYFVTWRDNRLLYTQVHLCC